MNNYELSIVIPCYNEAKNIPLLITAFNSLLAINKNVEIVLVNNGSTDNTNDVLNSITQLLVNYKVVNVPVNKGYGYGILQGLLQSSAPILSYTHADMQCNPRDVLRALDKYNLTSNINLLIKGNRINRNKLDELFTSVMAWYVRRKLGVPLYDINAQPKLFSASFFQSIKKNIPHDFSLDLYILYQAYKKGVIETIDVTFEKRKYGEAKGGGTIKGKFKLIRRTLTYINNFGK